MIATAILMIVLGFVALLKQKTYVDAATGAVPSEVEVPFFGKLKTNYPALVFVILGTALAWAAFNQWAATNEKEIEAARKVQWRVSGTLQLPREHKGFPIDWRNGTFTLHPYLEQEVMPIGTYSLEIVLPAGVAFEDAIEFIDYTNGQVSAQFVPRQQFDSFESGQNTLLETRTPTSRHYRPLEVNFYPQENNP
jgi:hypothetical protein